MKINGLFCLFFLSLFSLFMGVVTLQPIKSGGDIVERQQSQL